MLVLTSEKPHQSAAGKSDDRSPGAAAMAAVAGGSHFHQAEFVEPLHDRLGQLCWLDGTAVRITASGVGADVCGQPADVA